MRTRNRACWAVAIAAGLALVAAGCTSSEPPKPKNKHKESSTSATSPPSRVDEPEPSEPAAAPETAPASNTAPAEDEPSATAPAKHPSRAKSEPRPAQPVEPPPPPEVAKVALSDEIRATCLVQVGDPMPDAELPDLSGKTQPLASLLGKKLTVVCFWTGKNLYALEELSDLTKDVAEPYAGKDVRVVGVSVGEAPEAAQSKFKLAEASFPNLVDRDGAFFAKVAKERLPRTYLLDAGGKILWFDVEYSRSTRRDLLRAIKVVLGEK